MGWRRRLVAGGGVVGVAVVLVAGGAIAGMDFGQRVQHDLEAHSNQLFGIVQAVDASSTVSTNPTAATADSTLLVTAAKGLKVRTVAQVSGSPNLDQMALWPNDSAPTYVIGCNEQGSTAFGVVAISLSDGSSFAIIKSGLTSCDPIRRTAWGTILAGEENGTSGRLFEVVDPLNTKNAVVNPDGSSESPNIVNRTPVTGGLSYEGRRVVRCWPQHAGTFVLRPISSWERCRAASVKALAIARAVYFGAKVLILDEPTSALGVKEAALVLSLITATRDSGVAVVFITHNARHALAIGDRFTVLINGAVVATWHRGEKSKLEVLDLMAGGQEFQTLAAGLEEAHGL